MKKKLPAPTSTEAATPADARKAYVLLPDGTPARRLKPTIQGDRKYWNLALDKTGKTKRIPGHRVADFCELIPGVDYPVNNK
jgi:hypothetical protein